VTKMAPQRATRCISSHPSGSSAQGR
jgi:hypothetical protein